MQTRIRIIFRHLLCARRLIRIRQSPPQPTKLETGSEQRKMLPKVDSQHESRIWAHFSLMLWEYFLYPLMHLDQEETTHRAPCIWVTANEYTAKPRQGCHRYFWNLSRNLNESQWLLGICFLQSMPQLMKTSLNYLTLRRCALVQMR